MRDFQAPAFRLLPIPLCLLLLIPAIVRARAHAAGPPPAAQTGKPFAPSRTAWGDPDFDGVWNFGTMTPLERSTAFAGKTVLSEQEAADFERQTIQRRAGTNATAGPDWWDLENNVMKNRRTSLIVDPPDGRVPALSTEGRERATGRGRRSRNAPEAPEDLALQERCIWWGTAGPPMIPAVYNNNVQFVQTRDYVVILNEMIHDARIVPLDGRPHGTARRMLGDSRGPWEGSTLVVDTINFTEKTGFRGSGENLHLVERFTRTAAGTIEYTFTADDPTTWTKPWTASIAMTKNPGLIYEYACHEGNEGLRGILSAARAAEKAAGGK